MAKKASLKLKDLKYVKINKGKHYVRLSYLDANGKRHEKSKRVDTIEQAMAMVAKFQRELQDRGPGAWDGETMKWEDLLAEYLIQEPDSPPWYIKPLSFLNGRRIRSIGYSDCKRFREYREGVPKQNTADTPRSVATVNREMEYLRRVMVFGCQHGWLLRNPMLDGKTLIPVSEEDKRERIPTPEEEVRLLAACIPPREHLRLLIIGTLDTGLRKSALQSLKWLHLDWKQKILLVPKPRSQNKGRPKVVGVSARLYRVLEEEYREKSPAPTDPIFCQVKDFGRSYDTACRLAGIEDLRYNDLRHGYATSLMEAGVPEDMAMKAAGHKNRDIHAIYTNIDARLARQVADKLDELHRARVTVESELVQ